MYSVMEVGGLLDEFNWLTRTMRGPLTLAKLAPGKLKTMKMKFHYAETTLEHVCENWDAFLAFVLANVPAGVVAARKRLAKAAKKMAKAAAAAKARVGSKRARAVIEADSDAVSSGGSDNEGAGAGAGAGADAARAAARAANKATADRKAALLVQRHEGLVEDLKSDLARARVVAAIQLTHGGAALIKASEGGINAIPFQWASLVRAYLKMLAKAHAEPEGVVAIVQQKLGKVLSAADRAALITDIECAVEAAWLKIKVPLEAALPFLDVIAAVDSREAPPATDAPFLGPEGGRPYDFNLVMGIEFYREKWASYPATERANPAKFWRARLREPNICMKALAEHALWYLSLPFSTAPVERSFSVMRVMALASKLSMTAAAIAMEMGLRYNRDILMGLLDAQLAAM